MKIVVRGKKENWFLLMDISFYDRLSLYKCHLI
jgi:hypothetical protein